MQNRNYFEILAIEPTTDINLVKKAFRKQMMLNHPDKNGDQEVCKKIVEAWTFLEDKNNLVEYYESVQSASSQPTAAFTPQENRGRKPDSPSDSIVPFGAMLTVFIPMFVQKPEPYCQYQINDNYDIKNMRRDGMTAINPYRFKASVFDFNALTEIMNYVLEIKSYKQIGLDKEEVKTIVNQHSWYKHYGAYIGVSVNVNIADITDKFSELDVSPHQINAGKETYLSLKQGARIEVNNIIAIHLCGTDNTGMKLGVEHDYVIYREAKPAKEKSTTVVPLLALPEPEDDFDNDEEKVKTSEGLASPLMRHGIFYEPSKVYEEEKDVGFFNRCVML